MEKTERVGLYSVGVNVFLVSLKSVLAAISGSLALAADAIHSGVDVLASLVVLAGLRIARRKSRVFPYGLYKVENIVSVFLALLIFLAGYEIAREAYLGRTIRVTHAPATLSGVGIAILVPYLFSRYERRLGEQTGSPSLQADSRHFRTDVLSSGVVFAAILGDALGLPYVDRVGAGIIVIFIVRAGWELLVDGMRVLLDASLEPQTLEEVRGVIAADSNVAEIRSLVGRNSGRYRFIEAELVLRARDLAKAHQVSERIEAAIRRSVPRVDRVLIHYEPQTKEIRKWAIPLATREGAVAPHFGQAPYFAFAQVRTASHEVAEREVLANPFHELEKQKGIRTAEFLVKQDIDGLVVRESLAGKGPLYVLEAAGVEVVPTQRETVDEVLNDLRLMPL